MNSAVNLMNTISHPNEDQYNQRTSSNSAVLMKPPKSSKNGKALKSGRRKEEYQQKKKIHELSTKIQEEKSNERDTSKIKKQKRMVLN
jgi:hypothetical protein